MSPELENLRKKLKARDGVPGYEASVLAIKQRIAEIEGDATNSPAGAETVSVEPPAFNSDMGDVLKTMAKDAAASRALWAWLPGGALEEPSENTDHSDAVTSPEIASKGAKLMHHKDPEVRSIAASVVRQAKGKE